MADSNESERDILEGRILKGIGGFYYVLVEGKVYECRAKGKFRKDGDSPIPGDLVIITPPTAISSGSLDVILPRVNQLVRPSVANIDLLLIVIAAEKPAADLLLVDKLIIYARKSGISVSIVVNKIDVSPYESLEIKKQYANSGANVFCISAHTEEGLAELMEHMRGKCTCLAGQSAVGKSSILNAIHPGFDAEVGGLSKKTDRGKHTTRHSELMRLPELDAVIVDTPGFSILGCADIEKEELQEYYPEFEGIQCRFSMCFHHKEPDCKVKDKLKIGEIDSGRHSRYLTILGELSERKKYD